MKNTNSGEKFFPLGLAAVAVMIFYLLPGCQGKEPPINQKVAAMVIVVQDAVAKLSKDLARPIADADIKEIDVILQDYFAGAVQDVRFPLKRVGVTDQHGAIITAYPLIQQMHGKDFSQYALVAKALQNQGISQERFFLQNLPEIFLICAPIRDQGKVAGTVWFVLEAGKVRETLGVSTEEFLGINFNK